MHAVPRGDRLDVQDCRRMADGAGRIEDLDLLVELTANMGLIRG